MTQIYVKQNIHKLQTIFFPEDLVPSVSQMLKKHIRPGHAGIVDHSVDLSKPDLKKKYKKGTDRSNNLKKNECITADTSAIWQQAAHTTDQLTSPSC